jgi:hypothetical protein
MENQEKRKGGRPPLHVSQHRKNLVKVYLSDEELADLDELRSSIPRARFYRELPTKLSQENGSIDPHILSSLIRVGNNINQIARALNSGDRVTDSTLKKQYDDLSKIWDEIIEK